MQDGAWAAITYDWKISADKPLLLGFRSSSSRFLRPTTTGP
ncbi:MAG: hypothetical protein U0Z44_08870 [Kouleothrix sp.]